MNTPTTSARPSVMRRFLRHAVHPMGWLRDVCGGEAAFPLIVLFGLNAVDELDRTAFAVLLPNIRDEFNLNNTKVLGLVALASVAALALQVPIAQFADRTKRVPLAIGGALVWAMFSGMTGLATGVVLLTVARSGSSIGKAVIDPTHNSLLADYYPIETRSKVFSTHRAANAIGAFVGPLVAGLLAYSFDWRVPFVVFVFPTVIFAVMALRLREPVRGKWERAAMGASEEVANTEETVPSFAESWRTVQKIPTLQRLWWSLPFLATALIGFVVLASLLYEEKFNLDERARGIASAIAEPFQLVGLVIGTRYITKRFMNDMAALVRFVARIAMLTSVIAIGFAVAPNIVVAVIFNCFISATLAIVGPGILVALSLAIPARARATGFSVASLWVIPGLLVLPLIGWISSHIGIRWGMLTLVPLFIIGSLILGSAKNTINNDIAQVWKSSAARSEALYQRRRGEADLLLLRGINAGYDGRQVLFNIDFDLKEGEIVALLGTNGAGKSTLLKAISGVVEADSGAVVLDGRDITHAPPNEIAMLGISQMPGGQGVFGGLTVQENLQLAGWTRGHEPAARDQAITDVLATFPVLRDRLQRSAGDLSGGQQQMLALGMAFVAKPRVLLIDELSLGLAPVVIGQILPLVQRIAAEGTAVILVEQSVNVALTVAERAYFMERGTIRFSGPTAELLGRTDLLRSVFLSDGQATATKTTATKATATKTTATKTTATKMTAGAPPVLRVTEITRAFGGNRAVNGASFDVGAREILGMIGPNGAGKTTIFDLISGFVPVDSGRIEFDGSEITELGASKRAARGLGRSFQDARLFPDMTVTDTLAVSLERWVASRSAMAAALRMPAVFDDEERTALRVGELIELMHLGEYRNSFVRELSTGTRRVVDLACIAAHRPLLVLLDEPSSGIAQREVEALAPVLRRLRDEMGASLLVIEHDIPLVSSVSDRMIALDQGTVLASGAPADVLAHPNVIESYLGNNVAAYQRSGTRGVTDAAIE